MKANKSELKEKLNDVIDELDENANLNIIKSKMKAKPNNEFIMMFNKGLLETAIKHRLTTTDYKVLLAVLNYVSYGNVINLTQQTIADDLEITRPQVNVSYGKLIKAKIFYKEKGSLFLNPNYLVKGDLYKSRQSEAYKIFRSNLYEEFKPFIKDKSKLDNAVNKCLSF